MPRSVILLSSRESVPFVESLQPPVGAVPPAAEAPAPKLDVAITAVGFDANVEPCLWHLAIPAYDLKDHNHLLSLALYALPHSETPVADPEALKTAPGAVLAGSFDVSGHLAGQTLGYPIPGLHPAAGQPDAQWDLYAVGEFDA